MSTDKMRDDFEAWLMTEERFTDPVERSDLELFDGEYGYENMQLMWIAWQASRAALCVDLPAVEAWLNDGRLDREPDEDAGERMGFVPRIDVRRAIEAAGVRVKE